MTMKHDRHEFSPQVKDALARRASFICSNPDCRSMTLAPSRTDPEKYIYVGVAAHLTAAAPKGTRYDPKLTPNQRASIDNAIFLCGTCSVMVDKNNGIDFPLSKLHRWKADHEEWVRASLNKRLDAGDVQTVNIGPTCVQNGSVIVTQNQFGGQVAHSITNVGPQPRRVSDKTLAQLIAHLKMHPPQEIDFLVANDAESKNLAEVVRKSLLAAGWTLATDVVALVPSVTGIVVGVLRGDEGKPVWQALGNWVTNAGLHFHGQLLDAQKQRAMVYIAPNPI